MRVFERIDALERDVQAQKEVIGLLLAYISADLERPRGPALELIKKLREIAKK